ncbi:hypothetical protein [Aquamicrobium defluvii]|uniref:Uncharacterized protein n=1 Tax=Aquamicrobium defluvii TaxID=69279 RepID=A0A4R6Y3X2_9HYPH|nr:hypothetical protein [Aquamicrobium defluvii]TDR27764.1 hypothetical protein DES43_1661 [Aquamicrobium defluvii]
MAKYGVRFETADGTLEDAFHVTTRKAEAVRAAKIAAKTTVCTDVVRVWVDDLCAELGIASFATRFA